MSERNVGRVRRDGGWDRRYRVPRQAVPEDEWHPVHEVVEILVSMIVILAIFVGILMWVAIGQAAST